MKVPWTTRRSNQSIQKEISPEYSLEELMLKLQYFGHLMAEWHHRHNGYEFEHTLRDGEGEGCLVCWSKESDTIQQLNNKRETTVSKQFIIRPEYRQDKMSQDKDGMVSRDHGDKKSASFGKQLDAEAEDAGAAKMHLRFLVWTLRTVEP